MYTQTFVYLYVILQIFGVNSQNPEVEIPQGKLSGDTRTNRDGGTYYSFMSIPFAQPPVGDLRFVAPLAADGWEGTRDATTDLPNCGSVEDCLYLNVFTPGLPDEGVSDLPVMVFIHGGGFQGGGGSERMVSGQYLLTKDVILVSIQYRLGLLGFLSLDDPDLGATGNAGMKDQALALQWVQDNIEYFGGDKNNVLIFGQSAGSMSCHLQIVSPTAKGLFQKAILQSGVALSDTTTPAMRNNAIVLAEYLGIQTDDYESMLNSLKELSFTELIAAQQALISVYQHFFTKPIVEVASSQPTFLEELPVDIIKAGESNQITFMIGFNSAEEMGTGVISDFTEFIPGDFQVESGSQEETDVIAKMKAFYFGDEEPSQSNTAAGIDLATDFMFGFPSYRSVLLHLETAVHPIYFYLFNAQTSLNSHNGAGASHGDELAYLFPSGPSTSIEEGSVEDLAIKRMVNMWTNFAIYGNPTPDSSEGFVWEPAQLDQFNYVQIENTETIPTTDPKPDNFAFWLGLYEEYFPATNQGAQ